MRRAFSTLLTCGALCFAFASTAAADSGYATKPTYGVALPLSLIHI